MVLDHWSNDAMVSMDRYGLMYIIHKSEVNILMNRAHLVNVKSSLTESLY